MKRIMISILVIALSVACAHQNIEGNCSKQNIIKKSKQALKKKNIWNWEYEEAKTILKESDDSRTLYFIPKASIIKKKGKRIFARGRRVQVSKNCDILKISGIFNFFDKEAKLESDLKDKLIQRALNVLVEKEFMEPDSTYQFTGTVENSELNPDIWKVNIYPKRCSGSVFPVPYREYDIYIEKNSKNFISLEFSTKRINPKPYLDKRKELRKKGDKLLQKYNLSPDAFFMDFFDEGDKWKLKYFIKLPMVEKKYADNTLAFDPSLDLKITSIKMKLNKDTGDIRILNRSEIETAKALVKKYEQGKIFDRMINITRKKIKRNYPQALTFDYLVEYGEKEKIWILKYRFDEQYCKELTTEGKEIEICTPFREKIFHFELDKEDLTALNLESRYKSFVEDYKRLKESTKLLNKLISVSESEAAKVNPAIENYDISIASEPQNWSLKLTEKKKLPYDRRGNLKLREDQVAVRIMRLDIQKDSFEVKKSKTDVDAVCRERFEKEIVDDK